MDDCATLDVIDGEYNDASDSDEEQAEMWGRCFPIGKGFEPQGDFVNISRDQMFSCQLERSRERRVHIRARFVM